MNLAASTATVSGRCGGGYGQTIASKKAISKRYYFYISTPPEINMSLEKIVVPLGRSLIGGHVNFQGGLSISSSSCCWRPHFIDLCFSLMFH